MGRVQEIKQLTIEFTRSRVKEGLVSKWAETNQNLKEKVLNEAT